MAITNYIDFVNNYLVKNGMIGNAANMNKAPDQLKIELDEINAVVATKADALDSAVVIPIGTTAERPVLGATDAAIRFNTDTDVLEEWNGVEWRNITTSLQPTVDGALLLPIGTTLERPVLNETQAAIRFNTDLGIIEEWNGTEWRGLTGSGGGGVAYTKDSFIATAGQTIYTVDYTVGYVDIYVNGLLLDVSDYTATNGTSITLLSPSILGDSVVVISWNSGSGGGSSIVITRPVITAPEYGELNFNSSATCTYVTSDFFAGTQDYVYWQVASDASFLTILDSYEGGSNLTSWTPNIDIPNQLCYLRVLQGSDNHRSEWSLTVTFTTPNTYIETPTFTVTGELNSVPETPTITGSAFSVFNGVDVHTSTDWIIENSSNVVVWSSLGNTTNKTSISVPGGILLPGASYTFKVKYNGTDFGSSATASKLVSTLASFVDTPTLTVEGTPNNVPETPVLTGSAFSVFNGSSTHTSTDWVIEDNGVVVWSSLGNTTNKLTITVPAGILVESTLYTFKVKYNSSTYGSSAFGTRTGTTKSAFFDYDAGFGGFLEGGYYAGRITRADGIYALIVSPRATGQAATTLMWKNAQSTSGGCKSLNDGAANTAYLVANGNATVYPAAHFCNNLVINGFTDWYLPARDELEIAYRNLKPTTESNYLSARNDSAYVYTLYDDLTTAQGVNRHSVPEGAAYTASVPARTSIALFQDGGSESFGGSPETSFDRHWSSTEYSSTTSWPQHFSGANAGSQSLSNLTNTFSVRAFRAIKMD